jgi:predicted nucleotidyltransferase
MDLDAFRQPLQCLFQQHPVRLAYLFGSQATRRTHPSSDVDIAVLLYCADARTRIEFQVRTLRAYEDTIPLRRILSEAMVARLKAGTFGKPMLTKNLGR